LCFAAWANAIIGKNRKLVYTSCWSKSPVENVEA
jgi:hypothetical protein